MRGDCNTASADSHMCHLEIARQSAYLCVHIVVHVLSCVCTPACAVDKSYDQLRADRLLQQWATTEYKRLILIRMNSPRGLSLPIGLLPL